MKNLIIGLVLAMLCLSPGCNSGTEQEKKLKQDIARRDETIRTLKAELGDRDDQISQMQDEIDLVQQDNDSNGGQARHARKISWKTVKKNAEKIRKEDGKYECFYVVLEKTDADSVKAATRVLQDKDYDVEPTPWHGVVRVSSPQEVKTRKILFAPKNIYTLKNTRALGDDQLQEIKGLDGVKSVWPQSVLFFPATFSAHVGAKRSIYVDVKVIALPAEFFEEEKDRVDIEEFDRYDGYGAQIILPRVLIEHYNRFFRLADGWNLEYEKHLEGEYFKLNLASSSALNIEAEPVKLIDLKAVGYTDRIKEMTIIVKPEVLENWNKRMFEKEK